MIVIESEEENIARQTKRGCPYLCLGLGTEADARPVVGVRHEGVVVGVPHCSADKFVLVHRLRVAECHAFTIDIFHHL